MSTKQNTITGGATTITSSNLTANRILQSDANGKVAASSYQLDLSTSNTSGTWIPVMKSNLIQHRVLSTSKGSATQPIYMVNGDVAACTYTLSKSVPSNAVFTDTNTWRPVQNNLTSTSTTDSLSANQGRLLANGSARDSTKLPLSGGTLTGNLNLTSDHSYRIANRASIYTFGTTVCGLLANGGSVVRRYDDPNTPAGITASAFTNVSSKLVKKNIKNIPDDEAKKILNLRIVDFDYDDIVGGETGQIGLIAEETIDIFPHCVKVPDNYSEEATKQQLAEGKVLDLLELDYSKLVAPLIKLVQLQEKRINELEQRIKLLS